MDNATQQAPQVPQSVDSGQTSPVSSGSKTPVIILAVLVFVVLTGVMVYFILQPKKSSTENTTTQAVITPSPTAVAQTAEEAELEQAVSYSLEDSLADLDKDLEGL